MKIVILLLVVFLSWSCADTWYKDSLIVNELIVRGSLTGIFDNWSLTEDGYFSLDSIYVRNMTITESVGVFAYLSTRDSTTCTVKDTWYFIEGIFVNPIAEGFDVTSAGIISTLSDTVTMKIDWHTTLEVIPSGAEVHVGVAQNSVVCAGCVMGTFAGSIEFPMSGTMIMEVVPGDTISLQVMSDADGDIVDFLYFTTTIQKFF